MRPHHFLTGWPDKGSPMYFMRFAWIAGEANKGDGLRYELFKPWRKYDSVVFLKSMEMGCGALADRLRGEGVKVIFEANVDYYTTSGNDALSPELVPSARQREAAIQMTQSADRVITSSRRLMEICGKFNANTASVPDNIPERWIGLRPEGHPVQGGRLQLWWSGMASKAVDLLEIEGVLRSLSGRVHLNLVTGDLAQALGHWKPLQRERMEKLLSVIPHTVHRFRGIPDLLKNYRQGGVVISPRNLSNPYNQSHTEWKITLGMAAGLPAVASPQPSYVDVSERAAHEGTVRICTNDADWYEAFECAMDDRDHGKKSAAAMEVVRNFYSTSIVARMHMTELQEALSV